MAWLKPPTAKRAAEPVKLAKANTSEIDKWYDRMFWRKCRASHLACNPQCQRLVKGEQCTRPATIVHHIVSPYVNRSLFTDWQNLLAVCAEHHSNAAGEPLTEPNRYVITHGMFGATYDPNKRIAELRGDMIEASSGPPVTPAQVELNPAIDYKAIMARQQKHTQRLSE